jgi:hypothetical protein
MEQWDLEFVDLEEEGYVAFDGRNSGEFHFGCVHGQMDCERTVRDGEPAMEWTWDGHDEMDAVHGRGWAVTKGDELHGRIVFHGGDALGFVARMSDSRKSGRSSR